MHITFFRKLTKEKRVHMPINFYVFFFFVKVEKYLASNYDKINVIYTFNL